ncbi:MAG: AraC family ligand binding domain-containing protein [Chloroflexia bacterium]|nr:AraC family ligand binding domain-containing protein [Chloroflexia bacterium]
MRLERSDPVQAKGWCLCPWNSGLALALGYANAGIDDPHVHERITEIYLVARGISTVRIEGESLRLQSGDVLLVEPGEAHTFLGSSPDYLHFVLHVPALSRDEIRAERREVSRERLGL